MLTLFLKTAIPCDDCAKSIIKLVQPVRNVGSVAVDMNVSEIVLKPSSDCKNIEEVNQMILNVTEVLAESGRTLQGMRVEKW